MSIILNADSANIPLRDKSVNCCVTSPPYWGLRKYSGQQGRGMFPNLGLEATPEEYIENLVTIFREVRRVLRDDGVIWLNLGDCYAGSGGEHTDGTGHSGLGETRREEKAGFSGNPRKETLAAGNLMLIPHKVLIALQEDGWIVRQDVIWWKRNPMPESVNGWRWEQKRKEKKRIEGGGKQGKDHKGSFEGPKSGGKDKVEYEYSGELVFKIGSWRHTRAHENVFMLVKNMGYYCNQEAVREKYTEALNRWGGDKKKATEATKGDEENRMRGLHRDRDVRPSKGRNPRSVLDVPTTSYQGAHYATFPPKLIAPFIMASCPRRACPECGTAWAPVVDLHGKTTGRREEYPIKEKMEQKGMLKDHKSWPGGDLPASTRIVSGYLPTCDHYQKHEEDMIRNSPYRSRNREKRRRQDVQHEWIKRALVNHKILSWIDRNWPHEAGIVLDPFVGSGTTVQVAKELLRRGIGLDISMEYLDEQAKVRTGLGSPTTTFENLPLFSS